MTIPWFHPFQVCLSPRSKRKNKAMKTLAIVILHTMLLTAISSAATSEKLLDEMKDYARELIRKHPDLAGKISKKDAREALVNSAGQNGIFELGEADEKKLRRRKSVISDRNYKEMIKKIKALNIKKPEITFLIEYAEQEKIKEAQKLLAYRLMKKNYDGLARAAADQRRITISKILKEYKTYKNENKQAPKSLEELNLNAELQQFTNSEGEKVDWIYIGHLGPILKTEDSHVVLIAPEPFGNARTCGLDSGRIVNFKNDAIEDRINQIVEGMKSGKIQPGATAGPPGTSKVLSEVMKKISIYKDLNNDKLPSSLNDLNIEEKLKSYTDPATGEQTPWIYFGKNSKIKVQENVYVIIIAPKAHQDKRLAGLSNGKIVVLPEKQIAPILNK